MDIGQSGRQSDGGIVSSSAFGKGLEDATFGIPAADESVPHLGRFPYVLVGDEGFPLRGYLMRPYPGKYFSQEQRIFNYRLSRSRRIIEMRLGSWWHVGGYFASPLLRSRTMSHLMSKLAWPCTTSCRLNNRLRTVQQDLPTPRTT